MNERVTIMKKNLLIKVKDINTYKYIIFTILFARIAIFTVENVNGQADVYKYISFRGATALLGVIVLLNLNKKQLLSKINLVYIFLWVIGCFASYYMKLNIDFPYYLYPKGEYQEAFIAGCFMFLVWGIILIATIRKYITTRMGKFNIPFMESWGFLMLLMLLFRYDKAWVFFFLGPLSLFYLQNYPKKMNLLLLKAMSSGLVLSFGYMIFLALRYRPFDQERYFGYFANPNQAGIYYGMIAVVLFVLCCHGWEKDKTIFGIIKTVVAHILLGVDLCLILFSGSRTALLATLMVFVSYYIFYLVMKTKFWKLTGKLLLILLVALICINPLYTAIRYIPAYCNVPFVFESEYRDIRNYIAKDDPIDSYKYTDKKTLFYSLAGKMGINLGDIVVDMKEKKAEIAPEKEENEQGEMVTVSQNFVDNNTERYVREDITNGRMEIYATYLKHINWIGHENSFINLESQLDENGNKGPYYHHAHNSYLHMTHEFGIFGGIAFIIVVGSALFYSAKKFWKNKEENEYFLLPCLLGVFLAVASITEWVAYPMLPAAMFFYLSLVSITDKESK